MNTTTPSTQALADNIVAQVGTSIGQSIPILPKAFVRVLAKALSGVIVLLYKYAGFSLQQMFVKYASAEETVINGTVVRPLVEWGRLIGVGDPLAATRAELVVNVTVLNQVGSLPSSAQLLFPSTGVLYLTKAAVLLNAPTVQVTVRASSDQSGGEGAGSLGNLQAGDTLFFANPLPGVATEAVVDHATVTGADGESVDSYRARVISRFQQKPQGGALADYRLWASGVPGILNVYPYASSIPGGVDVYIEVSAAINSDGIPANAKLAEVAHAIDLDEDESPTRRPVNADVHVLPIARRAFNVVVNGLDAADVPGAQSSIRQALDEFLRSREPFIGGLSFLPRIDRVTQASVAGIVDDAISASGGTVTTVVLKNGGVTIAAYTLAHGEKAKLGTASFS